MKKKSQIKLAKKISLKILQSPFSTKAALIEWAKNSGRTAPHTRKIITVKPFDDGAGYVLDRKYAAEKQLAVQGDLMSEEKSLISNFVGLPFSYTQDFIDRLRFAIIRKSGVHDVKGFTWRTIINCIESFNSDPRNIDGEWSKPMAKVDIMKRLGFGLRGYRKLNTLAKEHPIRKIGGNRQLWIMRIDGMPENLRAKFK